MAINIAIPLSSGMKGAKAASVTGDTIQLALRQAREQLRLDSSGPPPVVFIGSSLIIAPLWSTDVKHGYFFKDCMLHHQSRVLQETLQKDGIDAPVVSLATAGQFVSDTYLIIDKFIAGAKDGKKPLALIYGVAPRDFMDDTTGGLALTSVFDELVQINDLPKVSRLFLSTFDEKEDFILNRSVYLYRKRGRYQNKFKDSFEKAVARTMHDPARIAAVGPGNDGPADPLAGFLMGNNRSDIWAKSLDEYSRRYKFFNQQQFDKQKECFKSVVALCRDHNIKLYVVAMPITEDNRKLMPKELYGSYIQCLRTTTAEAHVPFLDLQSDGQYKNSDFYDTVHLNGIGGERFLATMSKLVEEDARQKATTVAGTKRSSSPTY